jgi:MFS family permease
MHSEAPLPTPDAKTGGPWWRELNRYHWWVLFVASLGWMFDTMDQRIFIVARGPALESLLGTGTAVTTYSTYATSIFIVGWATGGLVFGLIGDRLGRTRTMMLTIIVYSLFTGLTALSTNWWDFALFRFLTGMGVGGEFAAGAVLVAEVMPNRARPYALGLLQALSAVGNIAGSALSLVIAPKADFAPLAGSALPGWRFLFVVGILPALLVVLIFRSLREPETWLRAREQARAGGAERHDELHKQLGDLREIFHGRRWRYHLIVGMVLGMAGQIGLWGVGFWTPELVRGALLEKRRDQVAVQLAGPAAAEARATDKLDDLARLAGGDEADAKQRLEQWNAENDHYVAWGTIIQDVGAFFGIYSLTLVTARVGRRWAFVIAFLAALLATIMTFAFLRNGPDVYWMFPILGFCNLAVFGLYAIYFPELFPTRLRSTGTGFCYNVARYITALGPLTLGRLNLLFLRLGYAMPLRPAAISLSMIYLVGVVTVAFAPETKDQPLPE